MNFDELEAKGTETVKRLKKYGIEKISKINDSSTIKKAKEIITQARNNGQKVVTKASDLKNEKENQIKEIINKELAIKAAKIEKEKQKNLERLLSMYGNVEFKEDKIIVHATKEKVDSIAENSTGFHEISIWFLDTYNEILSNKLFFKRTDLPVEYHFEGIEFDKNINISSDAEKNTIIFDNCTFHGVIKGSKIFNTKGNYIFNNCTFLDKYYIHNDITGFFDNLLIKDCNREFKRINIEANTITILNSIINNKHASLLDKEKSIILKANKINMSNVELSSDEIYIDANSINSKDTTLKAEKGIMIDNEKEDFEAKVETCSVIFNGKEYHTNPRTNLTKEGLQKKLLYILNKRNNSMDLDFFKNKEQGLKAYIKNNINDASKVFIVGHNRADLDSLGSSIGLYELAKFLGKDAYIIVDDDITKMESGTRKLLRDMAKKYKEKDKKSPFIKKTVFSKTVDKDSMIFITDTSNRERICISDSLNKVRNVIIIDHHNENDKTIEADFKYINPVSSSASEIVTLLLDDFNINYNKDIATALLAGINLDIGFWALSKETRFVCNILYDKEADQHYIIKLLKQSFEDFKNISSFIIGEGNRINKQYLVKIPNTDVNTSVGLSIVKNYKDPFEKHPIEFFAKVADKMLEFPDTDICFSLGFFDKDTIQVCARCNLDIINIGKVMEKLNGGGDRKKAATQIHIDNNLEQLQKIIKIEQLVDILNELIEGELQAILVKGEQRVLKK